ncbi:MAG: cyclin-like protein [Monoraphidium minutum]|nr:MAG: cyclin-like protein [Monoraphidium minutum]
MADHRVVGNMVFFTQPQLDDSPSRRDGVSAEEEALLRRTAQQVIIDVCQSMHVHVQYAYVAVYLCLRYYAVKSWKRNDRWLMMPAALSLALKMRESPKPVLHIIAEFEKRRWRDYERARPGEPRRSHDKAYLDGLKEPFNLAERAILFVVGFEFGIGDPYPHVAKQLRALGLGDGGDRSVKIEVQQMAWNFLRDSLNTTLCLRYAPEKIAATAVYLSFQVYRRPLALSVESGAAAEEGEAVEAPKSFCEVCNILPQEVIEIGNEITANYIAALRHAPAPQAAPQAAAPGRRPVSLGGIESTVTGDHWRLAAKPDGGAGGGAAHGGAANGAAASGASSAATPGRGGGSQGGSAAGGAPAAAPCGGGGGSCGEREGGGSGGPGGSGTAQKRPLHQHAWCAAAAAEPGVKAARY